MSDDIADREHPAAEKLAAYLADELSPEENDAVQEHVASCGLCSERLLDLQRFLKFAPDQPQEGVVDLEAAGEWRKLRERIEQERIGSRVREDRLRRVFGSLKTAYGLAAMLALGVVGLSLYTVRLRQELREPEMNSHAVFLPSRTLARGSEDLEDIALAPQEESKITFSLEAPRTASFPKYRLEVKAAQGRLILASDDLREQDGSFVFTLSTEGLPAGRYSIEVRGLPGNGLPPVEVGRYEFGIGRS